MTRMHGKRAKSVNSASSYIGIGGDKVLGGNSDVGSIRGEGNRGGGRGGEGNRGGGRGGGSGVGWRSWLSC